MENIIISCRTIQTEVNDAIHRNQVKDPVVYLESGLHNDPALLREELQKVLDRLGNVHRVLLVMGFCGNAVVGLKTADFELIVPRADDCLTLLLGSMDRRKKIQEEKPTYFLSKGWIDSFEEVEQTMVRELERMTKRYGKERAARLFQRAYANYERLGVIDTKIFDFEETLKEAEHTNRYLNLDIEPIEGTTSFVDRLLCGPWDGEDDFIVIPPYTEMTLNDTL